MSSVFLHTIIAQTPDQNHTWDLTQQVSTVRLTNMSPGGHGDAVVEFEDVDPLTVPPPGANLFISDALGPYWVGRIEEPTVSFRPGGGKVSILARGFASSAGDQIVNTTIAWNPATGVPYPSFPAGMSCHDGFKAIIQNICPFISYHQETIHVGSVLAGESQKLWGRNGLECFNEIASLGSNIGVGSTSADQIFWHVYSKDALNPGAGSTEAIFEAVYRSQLGTYQIAMAECDDTEFSWPLKYVANRVHVQWEDNIGNGGIATAVDPTSKSSYPNGIGMWRDHFIDGTSHVSTQYEAYMIAQSVLQRVKALRAVGHRITVKYPVMLTGLDGQPCPLWRVLAGRNLTITGLNTDDALINSTGNTFWIRETEWDEYNRTLTLITEEVESIATIMGRLLPSELSTLNTKLPGASRPAIPKSDPPQGAGTQSGPGAGSGMSRPGQLNEKDRGGAERDVCNPQIIANGMGQPIPTDKILGWLSFSFAGYLTKVTLDATKAGDDNPITPAAATVRVWKADWTDGFIDYANATTLQTLSGTGFAEWAPTEPVELYRNTRLGFTYVSGDAEILVIPCVHTRDASLVDPTDTNPPSPSITNVTTAPVASPGGGVGMQISWETAKASRGQVSCGMDGSTNQNWGVQHTGLLKKHTVVIPSLTPSQTFSFVITATSEDGVSGTSGGTFNT